MHKYIERSDKKRDFSIERGNLLNDHEMNRKLCQLFPIFIISMDGREGGGGEEDDEELKKDIDDDNDDGGGSFCVFDRNTHTQKERTNLFLSI
jgi:hypothetical protein